MSCCLSAGSAVRYRFGLWQSFRLHDICEQCSSQVRLRFASRLLSELYDNQFAMISPSIHSCSLSLEFQVSHW